MFFNVPLPEAEPEKPRPPARPPAIRRKSFMITGVSPTPARTSLFSTMQQNKIVCRGLCKGGTESPEKPPRITIQVQDLDAASNEGEKDNLNIEVDKYEGVTCPECLKRIKIQDSMAKIQQKLL